jgi:hypothetical protein
MHVRSISLAAALLASASTRAATPAKTTPTTATAAPAATTTAALPAPSRWTLDARASLEGGAFDGLGVRTDSGGLLLTEVALTPERKAKGFTLAIPFRLSHRQTIGASLNETAGSLAVEPTWRVGRKTELGLEAGASGAWRPDWPDLYQRTIDGFMPGTDRYSYLAWHAGASYWTRIGDGKHFRLKARYVQTKYVEDGSFDPNTPMHLTPRDNGRFELGASWRVIKEAYALGFRLDFSHRQDFTLLARDASSGSTNGDTNPTQKLEQLEPVVQLDLRNLGGTKVTLEYGYQVQQDPFAGYYSYQGHHPTLRVAHDFGRRLEGNLRVEGWFRTYGPDSKPSTDDGKRLRDDRALVRGELAYALGGGLALTGKAEYVRRASNYPDYVPGVYPATRYYDIQWDYTNLAATVGVEWRN